MAADRENLNRIRTMLKFHPRGLTISDIAQRLKTNRNSVAKYLEILELSGCVEMRQMGAAKVFYLSQRIPVAAILGLTKEGIVVINEDSRIIQVNERFCQMFNLNQKDVLSAPISVLPDNLIQILAKPHLLDEQENVAEQTRILCINQYDWSQYYKVRLLNTLFDTGKSGRTIIIEDITLEKEMEERLRINEARYRCIVEDQIEMICRFTPKGVITFANDAFCRDMMINPPDISWHSIRDYLPAEYISRIESGMKNATPENPVWDIELEITLPSGDRSWQNWIFRGIFDENGDPLEYQGVGRDISERKRAEIELLIKSCAIESSITPISLLTLEGTITYVNPAFIRMWGYNTINEVMGMPLENLAHGDLGTLKSIFQIRQKATENTGFFGNISAKKRDGKELSLLVSVSVVRDTAGNPLCLIAYFNDITSLVKMDREVKMKETVISHSFEGVAIVCPDGKIRYINPSFTRIFKRITDENLVGRSIDDLYSRYPQLSWRVTEIGESLTTKGTWSSVISDLSEDGITSIIQIHLSREEDEQGNQLCTVFSASDITQQRLIEESLSIMYHHLEEAIEHVGDPSFILDNQKRVVAWNHAMAALTGYNREEVIGTSQYQEACRMFEPSIPLLADIIDLPVRDLIKKYPRVSRFGSGLFTESFIPSLRGGKGALIWAKASPIQDANGQIIGVIQTMKDMTNWKRVAEHGLSQQQTG
jgi:PAS domain S-box-containing protein